MERVDSQTGIIGGGLIAEDPRSGDLERRITERSERLYRLRLVRRFLLAWVYPGNLVLLTLTALVLLFDRSAWGIWGALLLTGASIVVSARLLYSQHFKVRVVTTELRELQRAHRENMLDDFSGDLLGAQKRYRAQLPYVIESYRTAARKYRWKNHMLQCVVLTGSILTASVTAISVSIVDARWVAVGLSLLVAVAAALSAHAQFQQRGARLISTADALEREYQSVELRVGRYRKLTDERDAYAEFSDAVEELLAERVGEIRSAQ